MTVYIAYAFPKYILHGITVILKTSVKNKLKINLFKSVEQEQCPELEQFVKTSTSKQTTSDTYAL